MPQRGSARSPFRFPTRQGSETLAAGSFASLARFAFLARARATTALLNEAWNLSPFRGYLLENPNLSQGDTWVQAWRFVILCRPRAAPPPPLRRPVGRLARSPGGRRDP